jgi:hypothetical protein
MPSAELHYKSSEKQIQLSLYVFWGKNAPGFEYFVRLPSRVPPPIILAMMTAASIACRFMEQSFHKTKNQRRMK